MDKKNGLTLAVLGIVLASHIVDNAVKASSSCPQGSVLYHGGGYKMCYWVTPVKYWPSQGQTQCQIDGGNFGEILDEDALTFLKCAVPSIPESSMWIGYNDQASEGSFVNWNGDPMTYDNLWNANDGSSDCVEVYVNVAPQYMYFWNVRPCNAAFRVLCSKYVYDGEELDRAYTRIIGHDYISAYFYLITTNLEPELGNAITSMASTSSTECLMKGCVWNSDCFSAHFNTTTNMCTTFTCPKMGSNNAVTSGYAVWVVLNRQ